MSNHDSLSPRVRIVEAVHHLNAAQSVLRDEDDELADLVAEICREVDAVGEMVEATQDGTSDQWRRHESR